MSYVTENSVIWEVNDRKLKRDFKVGDEVAVNLGVGKNTNVTHCYVVATSGWRNKLNKPWRDQKTPTADPKAKDFAIAVRNYAHRRGGPEVIWVPAVVKPKRVICSWESWEKIYKEKRREYAKSQAEHNRRHEEKCVKADELRKALERNGIIDEVGRVSSCVRIEDDNLDKLLALVEEFEKRGTIKRV